MNSFFSKYSGELLFLTEFSSNENRSTKLEDGQNSLYQLEEGYLTDLRIALSEMSLRHQAPSQRMHFTAW